MHMLTENIPAHSMEVADFRCATSDDPCGLLVKAVPNGWPESKKDFDPLLVDFNFT